MKSLKSHTYLEIALAVLFAVTVACGGSVTSITSVPSGDSVSTTVAQTLQAVTPLASPAPPTATPMPSITPPSPTVTSTLAPPTSAPPASNLPVAARIRFATGATFNVTEGTIQAGQTVYYVIKALKGQPMIVMLNTPDQSAVLSVFGANGVVLLSQSQQTSSWQGTLPATQDYYFRITAGNTQNFTLSVDIPARIQFSSGQTETTVSGQTVGGYNVSYVAYAFGGQQMEITINTSPEVAGLTIWGFSDGQPYARAQNGVTDFNMTLPATQDYIIEVVPQGGNVIDYKVTVSIK
ncbi:MAG TPA: hypothetical protein VLE49_16730 [Anaerolineales bacterium]|nr:hypothetical protein [Anaerolineales bacterium]